MDTSDLKLQLASAQAEEARSQAEYLKHAADSEKQADAAIALAQERKAKADADLYQSRINESMIRAPFDGVVLSGDHTDEVGAPKKMGDELFIVGADNSLRAKISVSEVDIQNVH